MATVESLGWLVLWKVTASSVFSYRNARIQKYIFVYTVSIEFDTRMVGSFSSEP